MEQYRPIKKSTSKKNWRMLTEDIKTCCRNVRNNRLSVRNRELCNRSRNREIDKANNNNSMLRTKLNYKYIKALNVKL